MIIILIAGVFASVVQGKPGYRGVLVSGGKVSPKALGEGTNFRIPVFQRVIWMNVQPKIVEMTLLLPAATSDLHEIKMKIRVTHNIIPDKAPQVYQKVGRNNLSSVLYPGVTEAVMAVASGYIAEEFAANPKKVSSEIKEKLDSLMRGQGIAIGGVSVSNIQVSGS